MKRLIILLALAFLAGCDEDTAPPAVSARTRVGATDITFLVAADTHIGAEGIVPRNEIQVASMNALPGTAYPAEIGGTVAAPLGVLMAGDLTNHGGAGEWDTWEKLYGLTGKDGLLKYPIFECSGNHDRPVPGWTTITDKVRQRHGGLTYSWDWGDVHVVCLDVYPDPTNLRWLRRDLAAAGRDVPVVIYFHYSILGPFSDWWSNRDKDAFAAALERYNVIGIFHGHFHGSYAYKWKGFDVFNIGSPRHMWHRYLAVHVTDTTMTVAAWDWDNQRWDWRLVKRINEGKPAATSRAAGP
jgi:hypothetical protein